MEVIETIEEIEYEGLPSNAGLGVRITAIFVQQADVGTDAKTPGQHGCRCSCESMVSLGDRREMVVMHGLFPDW